jgi:hypothetical protein
MKPSQGLKNSQNAGAFDKLARLVGDQRPTPDPRAKKYDRGVIASRLVGFKFEGD